MFNLDFTDSHQTTCPVASGGYLMTLPDSEVLSDKSQSIKSGDGNVNTTLPAANLKKQTNDTVSLGGTKYGNRRKKDRVNAMSQS